MVNQVGSPSSIAPLPAGSLDSALAEFGASTMLPSAAYTDPAVLAWEFEHFFAGSWVAAAPSGSLAGSGAQQVVTVGREPVLLVRDGNGVVRGYANTCRHRGHELLPCSSTGPATPMSKRTIVCPYHGWTYGLDGALREAPGFAGSPSFDPAGFGLRTRTVEEHHGWIFVNVNGAAGPIEAHLRGLDGVLGHHGLDRLVIASSHDYVVEANWKIAIENYQECYHCPLIHPELCRVSPPESGENVVPEGPWAAGWMDLAPGASTMSLDGTGGDTLIKGLDAREQNTVMYLALFPNLLVSLHPDYVMTHRLTPLSVDRTRIECAWAFPAEAVEKPGFDPSYATEFWDITNRQDWDACASVQRGLATRGSTPGPLAPEEDGVHAFVTMVARGYLGRPLFE